MGIYGERPGSIGLLGGVLSHKKTDHIGLSAVGIVVPYCGEQKFCYRVYLNN